MDSSGFEHINIDITVDNIELSGDNFEVNTLNQTEFLDGKEFKSFIKSCEKLIRTSLEYRNFVFRMKELGLNHCTYFYNITNDDTSIELHHYPFTLYQIVEIVIDSFLKNNKPINTLIISDFVLALHYKLIIGIVPLTKTIHELAHKGSVFINTNQVLGNYKKFVEEFSESISSDYLDDLKKLEELSKESVLSFKDNNDVYFDYNRDIVKRKDYNVFSKEDLDKINVRSSNNETS